MKKAIIHISDLHICDHLDIKDRPTIASNKFRLTTAPDDSSLAYVDRFCEKVKSNYNNDFELYLLISGDVTNTSSINENQKAKELLLRITNTLNIVKDNVLLLPGDHDINRRLSEDAYSEGKKIQPFKQSYEYIDKYSNFSSLYQEVTGKNFEPEKIIVSYKHFKDEKIFLIGLNSNYKIDFDGGEGFIEYSRLVKEIEEIKIPEDSSIIVSFHHNIFASYEENQIKSWDKDNRKIILDYLKSKNVKCILHGNEHTRGSRYDGSNIEDLIISSDVGCFASHDPKPSFKIYEIVSEVNSLKLKNNIFKNIDENNINSNGFWSLQTSTEVGEPTYFELQIKSDSPIQSTEILGEGIKISDEPIKKDSKIRISREFRDELFKIVKDKKLFHSGHFHWSETSRAHNWIDITKILNDHNDLGLAKNAVIDLISSNIKEREFDFDFIIGLGIEGNILSTKTSIKWNKPYSFLPYSYRYDGHNDFEQDLCFRNDGRFKRILIITDVVNDGRTIRKLIKKREKDFFDFAEKIYVVSLFYTGDELDPNSSILNLSEKKITERKITGDHPEDRIEYFYVLNLKVEKCPYGENYRNECIIVKENLGCVHRFYDEEKADRKKRSKQDKLVKPNIIES
jgi:orotate phosphoribosyltransferase/3',5'-cyclic AMP phosphodiesterase CpdA